MSPAAERPHRVRDGSRAPAASDDRRRPLVRERRRGLRPGAQELPAADRAGRRGTVARRRHSSTVRDRAALDLQQDEPLGRTVAAALERSANIRPDRIRRFQSGCEYYLSPGGIEEEVRSALIEVEPMFEQVTIERISGFSTSGHVRAIEATQLLRAAQVGGLTDARLELNTYRLLRTLGRDLGPWIGAGIALQKQCVVEPDDRTPPPRRTFVPAAASESTGFLDLRCSLFVESNAAGERIASRALEYVVPRTLSINTVAVALVAVDRDGQPAIAVDDDDLPAAQSFTGNSNLLVAPAWRLPKTILRKSDAISWIADRIHHEYGVTAGRMHDLGGMYHPTAGLTPERVYPMLAEAAAIDRSRQSSLKWIRLTDAIREADSLRDGHLRIVLFRAAHALSRW